MQERNLMEIVKQLTEEFKLRPDHAENVVKLLEDRKSVV